MTVLALAEAWTAGVCDSRDLEAALKKASASPAAGREGREAREAALKAFKAVQQRLAVPRVDAAAVGQLTRVGRASLAALAALAPSLTPAAAAQLAGWRYNFARRLVSCKAYEAAHSEAWELFQQLNGQHDGTACGAAVVSAAATAAPATAATETANLMVGTVLTLVLCCVEGRLLLNADAVTGMLTAAESLPPWLSVLGAEEAARHGEAAYKYLYKAAVSLVEQQAWGPLSGTCAALLTVAGSDSAAQCRALAAVTKLTAHMPGEHGAAAVAAVTARACGSHAADAQLSGAPAAELLGLLCSASQRASSPAAAQVLQQAVNCAASGVPVLQLAALLLPVLRLQLPASATDWVQPMGAAIQLISDSIQQLEAQLAAGSAPLPFKDAQRHLVLLEAACLPANTLRRALAAQMGSGSSDKLAAAVSGDICRLLGGAAAVGLAASALQSLAEAVGVGSRQPCLQHASKASSDLAAQGHAAAVGLVTSARLRAAILMEQQGAAGSEQLCSRQALCRLLGWDMQAYFCGSSKLPLATCAVDTKELSWLASALFNVGVDVHGSQHYAAAVSVLEAALAAAAVVVWALDDCSPSSQETAPRLADFCRKCVALADAQRQAGNPAGALVTLGHSIALLVQLGFAAPAAWQPLVQEYVRLQLELLQEQVPAASADPQPVQLPIKRGRGAAGKKGPAAAVPAHAASNDGPGAAGTLLLVAMLQQHEAYLPAGSLEGVLEQEILCWGAAAEGHELKSADAVTAHCSCLAARLLTEVFPAAQQAAEHAGVLLALHQAGLPAEDGQRGLMLLERVAAALHKVPGAVAASLQARAECLWAVESGRQLARHELTEQQRERQRSHAAASTSAVGSREQDAAAVGQLSGSVQANALAWQQVMQHAQRAVEAVEAAGGAIDAASSRFSLPFQELAWLLGLHGQDDMAQQLQELLPDSVDLPSDVLAGCLFPACTASAMELQQQADTAAAEASRSSAIVAVQRAAVHRQAAEAYAAGGDMVPALYHVSESHRLLAVLFHGSSDDSLSPSSAAPPCDLTNLGWWRLMASYLGSLMQLGQLFESAGLADEALHALREGQRLAAAAGSAPIAALFAARVADIHCKQGELAAAVQAASAAEQQVEALPGCATLGLDYCRAAVQLVRAQVDVATAGGSPGKAAWLACHAAVTSCQELAEGAAADAAASAWCCALHQEALLTAAEAAWQREDTAAALEHAAAALDYTTDGPAACSALRYQQAAALLFLGQHAAAPPPADQQHFAVWGLGVAGGGLGTVVAEAAAPAAKCRTRKAPARQPATRGRSNAAAAPDGGKENSQDSSAPVADAQQRRHIQQLWQALGLSRGMLALHRPTAALLAAECGKQGYLHLAAWLLHSSLGSAMRLQYQLVLFSRRQQLVQRQRRAAASGGISGSDLAAQLHDLESLAAVLEPGLDWQAVQQLARCATGGSTLAAAPAPRGRRAAGSAPSKAAAAAAAAAALRPAASLAALEQQAAEQLHAWQAALPSSTAACSISALPGSNGGSVIISRMSPAGSELDGQLPLPPLLVSLPVQQLSASLSQHPIRALRMDDADDACATTTSVQSVLDEMEAVLADSGRSMREMSTDTKEQQREWWRARLSLDDRLAALTKHMDSSWLGPWRSLLLGAPLGGSSSSACGQAATRLLELLAEAGRPASQQQEGVLRHAVVALAQHAGSMPAGELRQVVHQLCSAAGLACSQEQQHQLEALLVILPASEVPEQQAGDADMPDAPALPAGKGKRAGKSVKFADDVSEPAGQQQEEAAAADAAAAAAAAASSSRVSRSRRPAAGGRTRRGSIAAAEAEAAEGGGGDASPVATLGAAAEEPPQTVAPGRLCHVFNSLSLDEAAAPSTAAAAAPSASAAKGGTTTARTGKHRSRLRMMQAGTPGPASARKPLAAAGAAATAPRPARELPLTVAKTAPPLAARPSSSSSDGSAEEAPAAGPVLLMLDGALQALPWESTPGLLPQRVYRMPSLACAAASAQRTNTSIDLSSTFYALNPSGDLATTQSTFQDWFSGMRGWEGKAGSAPTAAELATALQHHAFFLYCGHGGGEQYISVTKLRSLERCSAALLMGCSSGRLRAQQHYEPGGAVLAYLLAGCPAAVANLWDVTDRDIDRFSQAVLTQWISNGGGSSSSSGGGKGAAPSTPGGADMSAAVSGSRAVCKLPHLVGAAPVCYGLPSSIFFGS